MSEDRFVGVVKGTRIEVDIGSWLTPVVVACERTGSCRNIVLGITIAFTARSPLTISRSVNRPASSLYRLPTHVYGILTRNKEDTATSNNVRRRPVITKAKSISPEMTEMALKDEDEEDLTETQKLLKQVKDAGVAGGE